VAGSHRRTLRFAAFTNEESPFTRSKHMGSQAYAQACRKNGDPVVGMLCLEMLGCYSEQIGSQWLSLGGLFLPRRGDFLGLVGNRNSRPLLRQVSAVLRRKTPLKLCALILPSELPGARSSDHWSFWRHGFQAVMATDTAALRYPYYHTRHDTSDKLDFRWLSSVVEALSVVVRELVVTKYDGLDAKSNRQPFSGIRSRGKNRNVFLPRGDSTWRHHCSRHCNGDLRLGPAQAVTNGVGCYWLFN
jgi:Zn-dependent M28 family amino/carboxypeptidase